MKFAYEYRTRENERRRGVVDAPNRDAAYTALKGQGIRPSMVREVPGFFNALLGKGKRWMAIIVLSAALIAAIVLYCRSLDSSSDIASRQQVYGDPLVIQQCESADWTNVFAVAGDRLLASFAQPGREMATNLVLSAITVDTVPVTIDGADAPEVALMKRIVNGMKRELAQYLADGGTAAQYVERLVERQQVERRILFNKLGELERLKKWPEDQRKRAAEKWNVLNKELRAFGLKTVEMPEDLL